jgi:hypothetical protein
LVDDLGNLPDSLVLLVVVLGLLGGAFQPGEGLWVLLTCNKSWLLETIRHLDIEAVILLSWVQSEDPAFRIVPLGVCSVSPLNELIVVKSNLTVGHKSSLADLLSNLEVSSNNETVLGQDELERSGSVLTLNLLVLRWLLWHINESLSIEIEEVLHLSNLGLVLIEVVVPQGVLVVVVTAVHLESNAFINEHLVLALSWKLEALVGEDDVLPDLGYANFFQVQELVGVVVLVSLDSIEFTEFESEKEELVRILDQVVKNVDHLKAHLLDLDELLVRFLGLVLNLIDLLLGLDQGLQELWDLSTFECVVHL